MIIRGVFPMTRSCELHTYWECHTTCVITNIDPPVYLHPGDRLHWVGDLSAPTTIIPDAWPNLTSMRQEDIDRMLNMMEEEIGDLRWQLREERLRNSLERMSAA